MRGAAERGQRTAVAALLLVLFGAALSCAHSGTSGDPRDSVPGEEVLRTPPELAPLAPFKAPIPRVHTLPNGLKLYLVERPRDGIVALEFVVRRGAASDPPELPGVASLTAAMMEAGSAGKTQEKVAAELDAIGAELHVTAAEDHLAVLISAMPNHLPRMAELLAEVALQPNFDPAEWRSTQRRRVAQLIAEQAEPQAAAELLLNATAFGAHPFARPVDGAPASVRRITLEQLKKFFASFSPHQSAVVAVGGASAAELIPLLTAGFGAWRGAPSESTAEALRHTPPPPTQPRMALADFPGKPQSVIAAGQPAVARNSPDALALRLLNAVLGGSFTSRLNQNLRERHGYSYGAYSRLTFAAGPSPFAALSTVKTEVTAAALEELLGELRRAAEAPLSGEEMRKGRALLAYQLVQTLEQAPRAAHALAEIFLYDLPIDEYHRLVPALERLTPEQVQAAARRHLDPARNSVVIAGDLKAIDRQLTRAREKGQLPPVQRPGRN